MSTVEDEIVEAETEVEEENEEEELQPSDASLKLETKKFVLQALLEKAASVLPTKDIVPVLKNFQLEALPGKIRIVATDLELSVEASSELVLVHEPGTAVFPGKRFLEIAKEAEEGDLILDVVDGTAQIKVGRTTWELKLADGSDYPDMPEVEELDFHVIDRAKFLDAINRVRYAAATDTVRPSLMMIDISKKRMRAADGVRFQQVDMKEWPEELDIQIPIGAVDNLVKLLRSTELDEIGMAEGENHIVVQIGNDIFYANKLVAIFPEVDEVLLKPALANDEELNVDREELVKAIKRVRVCADPQTSAVALDLEEDALLVKAKDKFGNIAEEGLDVSWKSKPREVAFNATQLLDMLNMADVKSCQFFFGVDKKTRPTPILFRDDQSGSIGVLNQIRADFLKDD